VLPRLDRPLLYLSRGWVSMSPGQPILLLMTIGARSGQPRTTPLLYLPDGDRVIVLASNAGREPHPGWYYNLRAHPEARVFLRGHVGTYFAYEARGEERVALWRRAVDFFAGFVLYEQRITRQIPVMVLTPRSGGTPCARSTEPLMMWKKRGAVMHQDFKPIESMDALDHLVAESEQEPIIVFKHDPHCGISKAAYREMSQLSGAVALIDVAEHDDIAQELATHTGIKHESPQVIVLDHGKAIWSASHYAITSKAVAQAALQK